jgi:hypothetical protein
VPSAPPDDPTARRDALLGKLDGYYDRLMEAAHAGQADLVNELVDKRQPLIDELTIVAAQAPIPADVGEALAQREAALEDALTRQLSRTQNSMGQANRRGRAALRYRRSS